MNVQTEGIKVQCVVPFLKWLGGKRWLIPEIERILVGLEFRRYLEPFLGGGSVFFSLGIRPAFLSDINAELINTYIQVRDYPDEIIRLLQHMADDVNTYYQIRKSKPRSYIGRAARFLYLNRTAFSGIYRVNENGQFNVPFGNYKRGTEILWRDNVLIKASQSLQGANIFRADFELVLKQAGSGDLIYCDPTYTAKHNNNGFRKYNEKCFSWADQVRLAKCCREAATRGATIVVSNAYHAEIEHLYKGFESLIFERKSVVCPNPAKRSTVQEYLFIHRQA